MSLMMKALRSIIFSFSLLVSAVSFAGPGINSIVVLGDSLSDQGRWYRISFGLLPQYPYYNGRFSNGPVWVEYLAESMGFNSNELVNYALGGTTTNFQLDWWQVPYSLSWETVEFLTDYYFSSKDDRLYVVWSGGNDYWNHYSPGDAYSVVDTIIDNVAVLIDKGGRYFLLPNMPDMSLSPYAKKAGMASALPAVVAVHNTYMHQRIVQLRAQHPEAIIAELDISQMMDMLSAGAVPGVQITNMTDSCYSGNYFGEGTVVVPGMLPSHLAQTTSSADAMNQLSPSVQNMMAHSAPLKVAMAVSKQAEFERMAHQSLYASFLGDDITHHCAGYFFWDDIHPTTYAHKLLGNAAAQILQQYGFHRN